MFHRLLKSDKCFDSIGSEAGKTTGKRKNQRRNYMAQWSEFKN